MRYLFDFILYTSMTVYLVILDMCIDFNLGNVYYYLKYYMNATVSDIYSIDVKHFIRRKKKRSVNDGKIITIRRIKFNLN